MRRKRRTQEKKVMKHFLITLAVVFTGLFIFPQSAKAGYGYNRCIGYSSCGCPIYQRRTIISYDCYNRPVYRYISVPIVHRCRTHYRPPVRHCAPVYVPPYRYYRPYTGYRSHHGHHHSHSHSHTSVSVWGPNGGITWRR